MAQKTKAQKTSKSSTKSTAKAKKEPIKATEVVEKKDKQPVDDLPAVDAQPKPSHHTPPNDWDEYHEKGDGKPKKRKFIIAAIAAVTVLLLLPLVTSIIADLTRPNPTPPVLEINGVDSHVEPLKDDGSTITPIQITGATTTECEIASEIDDNLRPSIVKGTDTRRDIISHGKNAKDYTFYGAAWCNVEIKGTYTADDYDAVHLSTSPASTIGYTLESDNDGDFTLKYHYEIYANLEGEPDGKAKHVILSLSGKDKYNPRSEEEEILSYDLTITTSLGDKNKQFFDDWKAKIDHKIAEDERIEREKKEEEERQAREKAEREKEEAIANALTPSYTDLFRNHASYRGKYIKITGQVLQTDSSNSFCRVGTKGSRRYGYYDDVVYVSPCSTTTKILEDDIVSIIGIGQGTKTYTTVMGASTELPYISGKYFGIVNE